MGGYWTKKCSFVGGVVRTREVVYLAMVADEVAELKLAQTLFILWHKGEWLSGQRDDERWNVAGMAVARKPLQQLIGIGEWGDVLCLGSGDEHVEHVAAGGAKAPTDRGPLRGAREIGDSVYVVGMDRQVWRRSGLNSWVDFGPKARAKLKTTDVTGFEAIDGFSEQDMYAVGWDGDIWKFNGKAWAQLPSPTNLVLVDVCCAGNGVVYACGRKGFLVKGRDQDWEAVDLGGLQEDIWSLAWFNDRLYMSTMYNVYTLDNNGLRRVDMGQDQPATCHRLACGDGVLWSIGAKDVMAFDGKVWTRID